jgi:methylenetetrahydrofolate dehydrogenase (NADP+)/methenyltetrahydrofolate cyclohydrolase
MARILDGKLLAQTIQAEIAQGVDRLVQQHGVRPGLAAVLVGSNPASQIYVASKRKACQRVGIESWLHELPAETTQAELLDLVLRLNIDARVHGILVQLPLPPQIDEYTVNRAVSPAKDVDGFGPENLGLLVSGKPRFVACTPLGIEQLLLRNNVQLSGSHVVVVGRSNIVGKPLAILLLQKGIDATVTVCHSRTRDVAAVTRSADVIVMAIGQARFLKADMVRPGAVIVDVGTNRVDKKWIGDVDYEAVAAVASAITPVPGGVGPMTVTMLLHNTLRSAQLQCQVA